MLHHHRQSLNDICRHYHVRRLEVFGSAAEGESDASASDVDLLVEFTPGYDTGPWMKNYFDLRDELQNLLGRPVDLVMTGGMDNPYFVREANRTRKTLYAAQNAQAAP